MNKEQRVIAMRIKRILGSAGMTEVHNNSFIENAEASLFGIPEDILVPLPRPLSLKQVIYRPTLIPGFLRNIRGTLAPSGDAGVFEIGTIWMGKTRRMSLGGAVRYREGAPQGEELFELRGTLDRLFEELGINTVYEDDVFEFKEDSRYKNILIHDRSAQVRSEQYGVIGYRGELMPNILIHYSIRTPVAVFELDASRLFQIEVEEYEYREIPKYPAVQRDMVVLVPQETKVEQILNIIENSGGLLLYDTDLFDIYDGEHLTLAQKSLSFHLIFQAEDHVLSEEEVNALFLKIRDRLREEEFEVR